MDNICSALLVMMGLYSMACSLLMENGRSLSVKTLLSKPGTPRMDRAKQPLEKVKSIMTLKVEEYKHWPSIKAVSCASREIYQAQSLLLIMLQVKFLGNSELTQARLRAC